MTQRPLATSLLPEPLLHFVAERLPAASTLKDLYDLCLAFEKTYTEETSTREGIFYTPVSMAQYLTREALKTAGSPAKFTLLDPACGSGVFLLATIEASNAAHGTSEPQLRALLCHSLYACDKDPQAAALTRFVLARAYEVCTTDTVDEQIITALRSHVIEADTLLASTPGCGSLNLGFAFESAFPAVFRDGGFDLVIGNPPYGLSRDGRISDEENEILKQTFARYREGKLNKYLAFMARGYELLNARGVLSYVVPNAWLGIKSGKKLRQLFLTEQILEEITHFSYPVFAVPGVEAVVFRVHRGKKHATIRLRKLSSQGDEESSTAIPTQACHDNLDSTISLTWSADSDRILAHIRAHAEALSSPFFPFRPMIALQAYAAGLGVPPQTAAQVKEHPFHRPSKEDKHCYPYLEGRDIKRYALNWSGSYLRHGEWLAEPQKIERFLGPRVVLREIINPLPYLLNAAVVEEPMLYNKSVLHIISPPGTSADFAWGLLAILNSKLASFVLRHSGRKTQRKLFPKLVNDDLKHLPIAKNFLAELPKLAAQARQMSVMVSTNPPTEGQMKLQREIDQLVFDLYQLPREMQATLHQALE